MGKKGKVGGKLTITMNDSLDEKMLRAPGVPRYRRRGVYGGNKQINSRSTQTKLNKSSARNPTTARELNQNPSVCSSAEWPIRPYKSIKGRAAWIENTA